MNLNITKPTIMGIMGFDGKGNMVKLWSFYRVWKKSAVPELYFPFEWFFTDILGAALVYSPNLNFRECRESGYNTPTGIKCRRNLSQNPASLINGFQFRVYKTVQETSSVTIMAAQFSALEANLSLRKRRSYWLINEKPPLSLRMYHPFD